MVVLGWRLDLMLLEVFPNLDDSVIRCFSLSVKRAVRVPSSCLASGHGVLVFEEQSPSQRTWYHSSSSRQGWRWWWPAGLVSSFPPSHLSIGHSCAAPRSPLRWQLPA